MRKYHIIFISKVTGHTLSKYESLCFIAMVPTQAPSMILPLSNVMARAGQKVKLECEVTGLPTPDIAWFQNGFPLKETHDLKVGTYV